MGILYKGIKNKESKLPTTELRNPSLLGILGMRERAMSLSGELTIQGRRGSGTLVTLEIPLSAPH